MTARRRLMALVGACLGVLAVAGCAAGLGAGPAVSYTTSQPPSPAPSWSPPPGEVAAFDALAKQVASAWPRSPVAKLWKTSFVIPASDDLTFIGDPLGFPSDAVREAFGNGNLVFTGPPPSGAPAAVIRWTNGAASSKVPVLSEAQTFTALQHNTVVGRCPSCHTTPLAVTDAQPDTMGIPTNRGTAVVPAWLFGIPDLGGGVIQAALPPGSYVTENSAAGPAENLGPLGEEFVGANEASVASDDGRTLGMYLANDPCSPPAKYGGLVAEVGDVVVVGGWIQDPRPIAGCAAGSWGYNPGQYVTVRLAAPLGNRLVLDASTGLPAPYPFHPASPSK
jgi:hypothetical protein